MRVSRSILAIVVGCSAAGLIVAVLEPLGHLFFPPPSGVDLSDATAVAKIMDQLPLGALLSVLLAWLFGTAVGSAAAAWMAPRATCIHGLIVGAIMLAVAAASMVAIPHPLWFWLITLALSPACAWLGAKAGDRARKRP